MSKDSKAMQLVTANRLGDGIVVYLGTDNGWHENIREAALVDSGVEALLDVAAIDVAANRVVDPYAIDVSDAYVPVTQREAVRAAGPTIPFGAAAR